MGDKKQWIAFTVLLVNGFLVASQRQRYSTCRKEPVTSGFGELAYIPSEERLNDEECTWTFDFNKTDQDFVLVLDFFYIFQGSHRNSTLHLPHEERIGRSPRFQFNPSCQVYYNSTSPISECLSNLTKLYCSTTPISTSTWPPRIHTLNIRSPEKSLYFRLVYVMLSCPYDEIPKTETPQNEAAVITEKQQCMNMAVVIILSVLLILTIIAFLVLLFKFRKRKSIEEPIWKSSNFSSDNGSLKIKNSCEVSHGNVEKQMVDNIIYESCDKDGSSTIYQFV